MSDKQKFLDWCQRHGSDQLPLFIQPWWLDIVTNQQWDCSCSIEDDQLKAFWPFCFIKKYSFKLIRTPLLTPYWGPIFFHGQESNIQRYSFEEQFMIDALKNLPSYDFFQGTTYPEQQCFLELRQKGFIVEPKLTYYIDLKLSIEGILSKMQKRMKRYAQSISRDIELVYNLEYWKDFIRIHKETYSLKKSHYPYNEQFLRTLVTTSLERGQGVFITAVSKGTAIGFIWIALDNEKAYQLLSCFNKKETSNGLITALTFIVMQKAKEKGCTIYDMEGSVHPTIEPFFRRFGGERKIYYNFKKSNSKIWDLLKR